MKLSTESMQLNNDLRPAEKRWGEGFESKGMGLLWAKGVGEGGTLQHGPLQVLKLLNWLALVHFNCTMGAMGQHGACVRCRG